MFWSYFAGVALIAAGLGLLIRHTARLAALLSGVMVFSWFWVIHVPRAFVGISDSIAVFEALAVSGIAFVLAGAENPATLAFARTAPSLVRSKSARQITREDECTLVRE